MPKGKPGLLMGLMLVGGVPGSPRPSSSHPSSEEGWLEVGLMRQLGQ